MKLSSNTDQNGTGTVDTKIIDESTAAQALHVVRDSLVQAQNRGYSATDNLRDTLVRLRPSGLLSVEEMALAIGRDRNYVDSVWSHFGETNKGKQTRIVVVDVDQASATAALNSLKAAAGAQRKTAEDVKTARAERDRVVAMVYASKLLGPTAIATEVKIDRNHVLRIARRAGVAPAHRTVSRNQYSA